MKNITKISAILGLAIILLNCLSCFPDKNKDPFLRISIKGKNNKKLDGAWYKIDTFGKVYFNTKNSNKIPQTRLPITVGSDGIKDEVTFETCGKGLLIESYEVILNDNVSSNNCSSTLQRLNGSSKLSGILPGTLKYLKYDQNGQSTLTTLSVFQRYSYSGCFPLRSGDFSYIEFKKGSDKYLGMKIKKTTLNSDTKVNVVLVEDNSMISWPCDEPLSLPGIEQN